MFVAVLNKLLAHKKMQYDTSNDSLQSLLKKAYDNSKLANNREIVLVVGDTGVGKSTTINYLLGSELCQLSKRAANKLLDVRRSVIALKGKARVYARIGHHSAESETLFPKIVEKKLYKNLQSYLCGKSFYLCDCPGFNGSHIKEEERICAILSSQIAIKSAKSIKAVMVVLPLKYLTEQRAFGFREIAYTLAQFINNPIQNRKSIFFAFTKIEPDTEVEEIQCHIEEIERALEKQLYNTKDTIFQRRTLKQLSVVRAIKSNTDNILLIRPIDNEAGRKKIIGKLIESQPIHTDQFTFLSQEATCAKINKKLTDVALRYIAMLDQQYNYLKHLNYVRKEKSEYSPQLLNNIEEKYTTTNSIKYQSTED